MENYTLHLAMAALVGASVVAVSAYYMHRKTLSQLLEFAKSLERDEDVAADDDRRRHRKTIGAYRRASASLPDVTAISGEVDGEEKRNGVLPVDGIPAGLPRLRTLSEGVDLMILRLNLNMMNIKSLSMFINLSCSCLISSCFEPILSQIISS